MGKKLTLEDVKLFLEQNDVNHECELLSTEYINSTTPLKFKCNICGEEFERDFAHIKRKRFRCPTCGRSAGGGNNKLSIETVKKFLEQNDVNHECELLSTEYVDNQTPLEFRCNICGKTFKRDFNHVQRKRFRCPDCGITVGAKKLIYSKEDVKKDIWEKRKYKLLGEYVNAETPVLVQCEKGHKFNLVYSHFLVGKSGCKECANINQSGENHWNWKGGISTITDYFRTQTVSWRTDCLKNADYTCDITGKKGDVVVHHLSNFSDIVEEAFDVLQIERKQNISDYALEDRKKIADYIKSKHTLELGVVLDTKVHELFHKVYGTSNNTKQQYLEFKKDYLNGKYC